MSAVLCSPLPVTWVEAKGDLKFEGCNNNGLVIRSARNDLQERDYYYFYCFLPELKHENVKITEDGVTLDTDRGDLWRKVKLIFAEL